MGRRGKGARSAAPEMEQQQQQEKADAAGGEACCSTEAHSSPPESRPPSDCSNSNSNSSSSSSSSTMHHKEAPAADYSSSSSRAGHTKQQQQQEQQHVESGCYCSDSQVSGELLELRQQPGQTDEEGRCSVAIAISSDAEEIVQEDAEALRRKLVVDAAAARARSKLIMASGVCLVFMVIEVVAGIAANSLALMTDASHLLSDLCAFLISLFALWVSQLKGTLSMSFGYHRAEILGALVSVLLIWGVTAALVVEAVNRLSSPVHVEGGLMLLTATIGTAANLFMAHILHIHSHGIGRVHTGEAAAAASDSSSSSSAEGHGDAHAAGCCNSKVTPKQPQHHKHWSPANSNEQTAALLPSQGHGGQQQLLQQPEAAARPGVDVYVELSDDPETEIENMNLRAAYIHALGDLLQNIGVMIASSIIWYKPEYAVADPICTLVFCVFVLLTTLSIIREAVNVLMEGTPVGLDVAVLQSDLVSLRGVVEVHDLHVWSISIGRPALACHLVVCDEEAARRVLRAATLLCQRKHRILHTTIQTDFSSDQLCCDTEAHKKCVQPMTRPSA